MIAALAVGLWATQMSKDSLWKLPGTFLSFMILGILFGVLGGVLPGVSMVVPLSVLVLGMMILVSRKLNMNLALGMTACFALFHGLSHGAELAHVQGIWVSATGLLATTALLHGAGVGLGSIAEKARHIELLKPAGAAIAITGLLMLVL